jgi:formamidopyrimidine-DNA glycosylase
VPELPEVEAVCRRLREQLPADATIVTARILRPSVSRPQDPAHLETQLANSRIAAVRRKGKHILIDLDQARTLHVHLRMTGNLYVIPDVRFHTATTRAWIELPNGAGIVFDDPRALGKMQLHPTAELEATLAEDVGAEAHEMTAADFAAMAKKTKKPMKLLLMDQAKVAGLGNIYAAEALFEARIHPTKIASTVSKPKLERLHAIIVKMLEDAKESAYKAYTEPGYFAEGESFPVQVYDREGQRCFVCERLIKRIPQGGRSTYFCPSCQR